MKFFKHLESGRYFFEGRDQKHQLNLINAQTGSEYFLPGYYLDEGEYVKSFFKEVSKEEVLAEIPSPYFPVAKEDAKNMGGLKYELTEFLKWYNGYSQANDINEKAVNDWMDIRGNILKPQTVKQ